MSKFKAGDVFVDYDGDERMTIVFADGVWLSDAEKQDYLDEMGEEPTESVVAFEDYNYSEYREGVAEILDLIEEDNLINKEEHETRQKERQVIVDMLKAAGVNTSDLIVSEGVVYMGYSECAGYIQGTHAWCSSSMSC
ncbi:hypothetical protein [Citrobacter phage Tr1]|nr:hypothetical protein [Citrobacter phage Tr1]